jgi:hypothetical protein
MEVVTYRECVVHSQNSRRGKGDELEDTPVLLVSPFIMFEKKDEK